jgi:hypothetical protein
MHLKASSYQPGSDGDGVTLAGTTTRRVVTTQGVDVKLANTVSTGVSPAIRAALTAIGLSLMAQPVAALVNTGTDDEARLPYWEIVEPGVSIRLVQRLPDQTRGFFQARGFSVADSELIAQGCVFQTVFKNLSPATEPVRIEYDLREWVVHAAGAQHGMKTREHWKKIWTARRAPQAARLAFEWGLLPTRQTYGPGDYNWGMSVFGLAPGTPFELDVVWYQNGERRAVRVQGMRCAADVHPAP